MNQETASKYKAEIIHWLDGGEFLIYIEEEKKWGTAKFVDDIDFLIHLDVEDITIVINDKHVEARKHFALSGEIEVSLKGIEQFYLTEEPVWHKDNIYRPKKQMWYDMDCNVGKVIKVKDAECEEWSYYKFEKYRPNAEHVFKCSSSSWKYAELLTLDDIEVKGER